jgi:integrase
MNTTVALYIRNKAGYYFKAPKRPTDLDEDQGRFYLSWYEGTRKRLKPVGRFGDAARVAKNNMEAELKNTAVTGTIQTPAPPVTTHAIDEAAAKYLDEVFNGKAHPTYMSYEIAIRKFRSSCTVASLEEITREDILKWKGEMIADGAELSSVKTRLRFFKTFLSHYGVPWPMVKGDRIKADEKTVEGYGPEEMQALFELANADETDLFQFLLFTGAREQEAMYAGYRDIDFNKRLFKFSIKRDLGFVTKNRKERTVPIPDSLVALLTARRERYPNSRLIFGTEDGTPDGHMLRTIQRLAYRAGLNCKECYTRDGKCCKDGPVCHHWGLHRWRKTYATMHHEAGISVHTIKQWLGHSDLVTTLRYLAGSDNTSETTRKAVNNTFIHLVQKSAAA